MLKTLLELSRNILDIKREEFKIKSISNKDEEYKIQIQCLELKSKEQSITYQKLMASVEKNVTDVGILRKILTDTVK